MGARGYVRAYSLVRELGGSMPEAGGPPQALHTAGGATVWEGEAVAVAEASRGPCERVVNVDSAILRGRGMAAATGPSQHPTPLAPPSKGPPSKGCVRGEGQTRW